MASFEKFSDNFGGALPSRTAFHVNYILSTVGTAPKTGRDLFRETDKVFCSMIPNMNVLFPVSGNEQPMSSIEITCHSPYRISKE